MVSKDREMKKQATRVQKAMRETVDLDGLGVKIFGKYLKFLQQKVAAKLDEELNPTPDPKAQARKKE